jgi:hypothetical protein
MPNRTVWASATASPNHSRRAAFGLFVAAPAAMLAFAAGAPVAASVIGDDAEIIALSAEIHRLREIADKIAEERVDPFQDEFEALLKLDRGILDFDARAERDWAFSRQCGREGAIGGQQKVDDEADSHFRRMMAIPALTQPGKAAKVSALLVHVQTGWRGDAEQLDWPEQPTRALLAELAGMGAEEIAAI